MMLFSRKQHVLEAPEQVRANDFALIGASQDADNTGPARGDAEMIGPGGLHRGWPMLVSAPLICGAFI